MDDSSLLVWSLLFSGIGTGFFIYGKRQRAIVPLVTGLLLFVFPYVMPNVSMLLIVGAILIAIPYFVRR